MSKFLSRILISCLFLFLTGTFAVAQSSTATLSGTVEDENGQVIPNATVTISDVAKGFERKATTNDTGSFTFVLLPASTYTVLVEQTGFGRAQLENIVLNVGDQKALQIQLKVGDVNAAIEVQAEAPLVDTDGGVRTVVDRQFVQNIPLNGRSFQSLIALTPGVVMTPATGGVTGQFSVNGQRTTANAFLVDGVSANIAVVSPTLAGGATSGNTPGLTALGTTQSLASAEELQEFAVQTSTYAAEYGRQPGGQISISTRSGQNQFHGSLFDYVRNDIFDANDWFANANGQPHPPLRQNDFGGSFSGPVFFPNFGEGGKRWYNGRNRTFFFFNYEGLRLLLPKFTLASVPNLCLRGKGPCPSGYTPAPATFLPLLNSYPMPNGRDLVIPTGNPGAGQLNGFADFAVSYSDPSDLDSTSIRLDHQFGSKMSLFGRFNHTSSTSASRQTGQLNKLEQSRNSARTLTVGATWMISPYVSNDVRVNRSSNSLNRDNPFDNFGGADPNVDRANFVPLQFPEETVLTFSLSAIPGIGLISFVLGPNGYSRQNQFNIVDNVSYVRGVHQLKFGVDYRRLTPDILVPSILTWTFRTRAELETGRSNSGQSSLGMPLEPIYTNFSAFAQDQWRASKRLTLTLGLRWEVNPPPGEANGNIAPAVDQIDDLAAMRLLPPGSKQWKTTFNNFAPRFGVAYQLTTGQGSETVIRGGFGVYYDTGNENGLTATAWSQPPFRYSRQYGATQFPLNPALVPLPATPGYGSLTTPYPTLTLNDPGLRLPYTLQWNLSAERSFGAHQSLTVSYVGAAGKGLLQQVRQDIRSRNPLFTFIDITTNNATSEYHSLQSSFQRRLSKGLQALVSHTWSHAIDDDSTSFTGSAIKRGNSRFDVRHVLAGAATYDISFPRTNGFVNALFRGWSLDGRVQVQSAAPIDIVANAFTDPETLQTVTVRPNVIPGVPIYVFGDQYPGSRILNNAPYTVADNPMLAAAGCLWIARPPGDTTTPIGPARGAFCTPPTGQSGNLGRFVIRGLPAWQVDMSLRREFKIGEQVKLLLRAEAFNVFNHPNFGAIQTSLTNAAFGQATNMLGRQFAGSTGLNSLYQIGGPRSMQFAARLSF
jgi:hypothetical protein